MSNSVSNYQKEMHNNLGFFATWLPAAQIQLGDFGTFEAGRFRRVGTLKELGINHDSSQKGRPQNLSYSAATERTVGGAAEASSTVPIASSQISIRFTKAGGYVFEATGVRSVELTDRMALASQILDSFAKGKWKKEWLLVDGMYEAASATIIVSEDASSEIVFNATANVPLGSLPLADPKLGLTISSLSGRIVHVVAEKNLTPLYSCLRVHDPLFGAASLRPARDAQSSATSVPMVRVAIEDLLNS